MVIFLRFMLLILFVSYYSAITLFYHAHLVNGQIIVHSHPYIKSQDKQNSFQSHFHSPASYSLIQQLNQICWENSPDIPQIPNPLFILCEYKSDYKSSFISSSTFSYTQLRAPPFINS